VSLTVRLDPETKRYLAELVAGTDQDKSSLVRELIRERWQQQQKQPTITETLGGHPDHFLDTLPPGSAERSRRRQLLVDHLAQRAQGRQA
jgi:Arc/MetJ-type ribon-helix-helix transcriptional regulator